MENRFCQSCGMPMTETGHFGTEKGGSRSDDYCRYCYQDGRFVADCTMEQILRRAHGRGQSRNERRGRPRGDEEVVSHTQALALSSGKWAQKSCMTVWSCSFWV